MSHESTETSITKKRETLREIWKKKGDPITNWQKGLGQVRNHQGSSFDGTVRSNESGKRGFLILVIEWPSYCRFGKWECRVYLCVITTLSPRYGMRTVSPFFDRDRIRELYGMTISSPSLWLFMDRNPTYFLFNVFRKYTTLLFLRWPFIPPGIFPPS